MAGFEVTLHGRFWVSAEAFNAQTRHIQVCSNKIEANKKLPFRSGGGRRDCDFALSVKPQTHECRSRPYDDALLKKSKEQTA